MSKIEWTRLDAVTMQYENEHGTVLREELDRRVIQNSRGWAVIIFTYRERQNINKEFGEVRFAIEKWVKRRGRWRPFCRLRLSFQNMLDFQEMADEWVVTDGEEEDGDEEEEEEDEDEGDVAAA